MRGSWARCWCGRREALVVGVILMLAALVHAINMFGCPYYEHDEGHRMARAWAVLSQGKLDPYMWPYDETPLSYVELAGWVLLTGGFHTFGTAIDSGRALMLVLQVLSTFCVYGIARSVSRNMTIAALAALMFGLSPFGIYEHRIVYEDNIETFWMLVSLLLVVSGRMSRQKIIMSAVAMGLSILSKQVTVFVVPAFGCLVACRAEGPDRWRDALTWLATVSGLVLLWPLYVALRGELLPGPHPSLIGGALWQLSRARDRGLLDPGSLFWRSVRFWRKDEPVLIIGGSVSGALCLLVRKRYPDAAMIALSSFCLWAFFGRGGVVARYYVIPLLPLLSLNLALACHIVASSASGQWKSKRRLWRLLLVRDLRTPCAALAAITMLALGRTPLALILSFACRLAATLIGQHRKVRRRVVRWLLVYDPRLTLATITLISLIALGYTRPNRSLHHFDLSQDHFLLWHDQQTAGQRAAIRWVTDHVPTTSTLLVEHFLWTDLHDGADGGRVWPRAFPYIRVEHNPRLRQTLLGNDWKSIDYIAGGRSTVRFAFRAPHPRFAQIVLVAEALKRSSIVAAFDNPAYPVWIHYVVKSDRLR